MMAEEQSFSQLSKPPSSQGQTSDVLRQMFDWYRISSGDRPKNLGLLSEFLNPNVEWEKPIEILPIGEMEERLSLISELQEIWEKRFLEWTRCKLDEYQPFSDIQIAALMVYDLVTLRTIRFDEDLAAHVLKGMYTAPSLAKLRKSSQPVYKKLI